tara:strand:- start:29 stop:289 length:261 start_codon:yes stop_codon:yes gene_type:complete
MTKPTTTTEILELATIALENRDEDTLLELFNAVDEVVHHRAKDAFKKLLWTMANAALELPERFSPYHPSNSAFILSGHHIIQDQAN